MMTATTMMMLLMQVAFLAGVCVAFQQQPLSSKTASRQFQGTTHLTMASNSDEPNRRKFLATSFAAAATGLFSFQQSAMAIPMVSTDEFNSILRDSPLSVQVVEFSGPRSDNVVVKLVDGTVFGLKDIIESPSDPRSPLKVVAQCREANVKTKFVDLEAALAGSPKKRKMYTNERVQKAYELQREKQERIRLDELDRLAQVAEQEAAFTAQEAAKSTTSAETAIATVEATPPAVAE